MAPLHPTDTECGQPLAVSPICGVGAEGKVIHSSIYINFISLLIFIHVCQLTDANLCAIYHL